jgi:5-methylcytosine-specific restriction enzyme B
LFVSEALLAESIERLHDWYRLVPAQKSRHVWSFLPVKLGGAMPNKTISYKEEDDQRFLNRFFRYRDTSEPYFDPFSRMWLKAGYGHSNAATFRKNTFQNRWQACTWEGDAFTLKSNYHLIIRDKVLTKAGQVSRIPVLPLAVWFFKRPSVEWPTETQMHQGVPQSPKDLVALFRRSFYFEEDPGWNTIFDDRLTLLGGFPDI